MTPTTIKSGFRVTGIIVIDVNAFIEADCVEVIEETPEPLTPKLSTSGSRATLVSNISILHVHVTPKKPLNRSCKSMESSMLTSPDVLSSLKKRATKRNAKQATNEAKKTTPTKCIKQTLDKSANPTLPKLSAKRAKIKRVSNI